MLETPQFAQVLADAPARARLRAVRRGQAQVLGQPGDEGLRRVRLRVRLPGHLDQVPQEHQDAEQQEPRPVRPRRQARFHQLLPAAVHPARPPALLSPDQVHREPPLGAEILHGGAVRLQRLVRVSGRRLPGARHRRRPLLPEPQAEHQRQPHRPQLRVLQRGAEAVEERRLDQLGSH
jgi:hypothetical protein